MKKRYIVLGILVAELMMLPLIGAAGWHLAGPDVRSKFAELPRAAHVENPLQPGHLQLVIASDGPFVIIAEGAVTPVEMSLAISGKVNGNPHGMLASDPGAPPACRRSEMTPRVIYRSTGKTAINSGPVIDQAVVFNMNYERGSKPKFTVMTQQEMGGQTIKEAIGCGEKPA